MTNSLETNEYNYGVYLENEMIEHKNEKWHTVDLQKERELQTKNDMVAMEYGRQLERENSLKLFYWKFVESINTMYPHVYFALARDKNQAIDLVKLQLDFSDRQKEKESNFILKSIALNEPEIIETEKGVLILSKC